MHMLGGMLAIVFLVWQFPKCIEAFEEECGLDQIPDFGLQFARMDILEGDIESE